MPRYLGIDASTQSITGLIIDTDAGSIAAEVSINFDEHFAEKYGVTNGVDDQGNGVVHSYPLMWIEGLELLFRTLRDEGHELSEISAVSGAGQQHGTVYLNDGAPTALAALSADRDLHEQLTGMFSRATAPVWMDSSTGLQCREIEAGAGGPTALLDLTGNPAFERFSGPQIRKFFQEEPDAYADTASIALVSSFIASVLAGRLAPVDTGDGSGTNLMDIRSRQWSAKAQDATAPELARRMAPIAQGGQPIGSIHPYFVQRHGFSNDCLVVPFSGDNPCSLVGLGLVEPGHVALSLGTSDTLFACMAEPRFSSKGEGCVFASPDERHYMALICLMNGSLAREAVRDRYGLDWRGFTELLRTTEPGNNGRLMLPYFDAEIVPQVPAGVARHDLDEEDAAGNVRAVIEAQAMSSYVHSRWMGVDVASLHVTGGGSANEEILRVFADVYGCPVHRRETTNAAALGGALKAFHGHRPEIPWPSIIERFCQPSGSTIHPDAGTRAAYDDLIAAYADLERRHTGQDSP
jgi:xylulokinase